MSKIFCWSAIATLLAIPIRLAGTNFPGLSTLAVCAATLIVILGKSEWLASTPSVRAAAWIGDFSYSLYLVHWPIAALFYNAWFGEITALMRGCYVLLSIALGYLLYRCVEKPLRKANFGLSWKSVGWALRFGATPLQWFWFHALRGQMARLASYRPLAPLVVLSLG